MSEQNIPMQPVQSSNLSEMGYDPDRQVLALKFTNGAVYHYDGVGPGLWAEMQDTPSVGSFFHARIKSVYPGRRA